MSSKRPASISDLRQRVARARLPGGDRAVTDRARRMLDVYLETADAHGLALADVARELKSGTAALRIGGAELEQQATSAALRDAAPFVDPRRDDEIALPAQLLVPARTGMVLTLAVAAIEYTV